MSLEESSNPKDEARKSIRAGVMPSVKEACKAGAFAITASGLVGGFFNVKGQLTGTWIYGLILIVLFVTLVAYYVFEFDRFRLLSILTTEILDSEKNYEAILAETRKERDDLRALVTQYKIEVELVRTVGMAKPAQNGGGNDNE